MLEVSLSALEISRDVTSMKGRGEREGVMWGKGETGAGGGNHVLDRSSDFSCEVVAHDESTRLREGVADLLTPLYQELSYHKLVLGVTFEVSPEHKIFWLV